MAAGAAVVGGAGRPTQSRRGRCPSILPAMHRRVCTAILLIASACADPARDDDVPWTSTLATASAETAATSDAGDTATPADTSGVVDTTEGAPLPDVGEGGTTGSDCTAPDPAPAWQLAHLQDVVARLSGASDLDGATLPDRATAQRRALVATWLLQHYGALGIDATSHDYGTGTNIIATIPATGASQGTLVLGAHYDSVPDSPGADDNATGIAVITAAARHLAETPCRTHDVLVVAFDEEEIGLVGSTAFATKLVVDRTPVVSVHTIDQIGWDADGDRVLEIERPDPGLFEFYDDVALDVPTLGGLTVTDTGFTDHVAFRAAGFVAVGLSEEYVSGDTTPHYHLPSDRYDTVEFGLVVAASTLVNRAFGRAVAP